MRLIIDHFSKLEAPSSSQILTSFQELGNFLLKQEVPDLQPQA